MWFFPIAIAAGNTVVAQAEREGPVAPSTAPRRAVGRGRPARRACSTSSTATRWPSTGCSSTPTSSAVSFVGSTPIARYVYETGTAHGKRVQALGGAKNHMVVLPDADLDLAADAAVNAGFGSAGERCMAISALVAVEPVGRRAGRARSRERMATLTHRRRPRAAPTWARWSPRRTATRWRPTSTPASSDGRRRSSSTAATSQVDGAADGFWLGPTLFDHVTPEHDASTPTRSSARCCRVVRVGSTTRRSRWSTPTRTATAPRSSPTTAARPGASRTRSRSAWSASTCRSRCRWPTTPSAAGRPRCSATPTPTAPRACTSSPAARSISGYILVSAVITLAACAALPDRSRADINDDATYARA